MPSFLTNGSLSQTVDEHIAWFVKLNRLAFLDFAARSTDPLPPSANFTLWYKSALTTLPQDQPAMDRLAVTHDQLHTLAKLVLMKTPKNAAVARADYDSVTEKYRELMQGLRRLERAFSVAASGLDLLTGLRSRVGLAEDLAREHSRSVRTGTPFCLAILDIDHFKSINDTHGHDAGDKVLAAVADHVSRGLRPFDDAYRMGGEEFLLCLKEADLGTGMKVLERLRGGLEQLTIALPDGPAIKVTASFGLTVSSELAGVEEMIHRADQALYRAKNGGRNRIAVLETEEG